MLICKDCGHIFLECETAHWREDRGEFWGMPAYEDMYGCPVCSSGYIEDYDEEEEYDYDVL